MSDILSSFSGYSVLIKRLLCSEVETLTFIYLLWGSAPLSDFWDCGIFFFPPNSYIKIYSGIQYLKDRL